MLVEKRMVITNKQGLHARPAALFVQIANKFTCSITVRKDDQEVNGKSIMGILMLAAEKGSHIHIKAEGSDAREAVLELEKLISGDMGEGREKESKDKR
ncbi:MAG: HPr family phosphocarrier protein [Candidatus Omnitrophota bacterium]